MRIKDTVYFDWYKHLFILFLLVVCLAGSVWITGADFTQAFGNSGQMAVFFSRFLHPDFGYFPNVIDPMIKTLKMSVLGTSIGTLLAVPFAFLATTVVTRNRAITTVARSFMNIIRTIPNLLLAALLVAIIGIGEATGVITIAVFTFGMVSQLVFEAIETIDYGPIESAESVGANRLQIAAWSIAPQILSQIASYAFYALEINIRASTVLGYVGAGGIGVILNSSLALLKYEQVSVIILSILLVVAVVDALSEAVRRKLK